MPIKSDMSAINIKKLYAKAQDEAYFRLLPIMYEHPHIINSKLGIKAVISPGTLNDCLNPLMNKCFVKLEKFQNSKQKFKYAFFSKWYCGKVVDNRWFA